MCVLPICTATLHKLLKVMKAYFDEIPKPKETVILIKIKSCYSFSSFFKRKKKPNKNALSRRQCGASGSDNSSRHG